MMTKRARAIETLVFTDFDDTLWPTTHFELQASGTAAPQDEYERVKLELLWRTALSNALKAMKQIGSSAGSGSGTEDDARKPTKLVVVTAANSEWIAGCKRRLAWFREAVKGVEFVSARDRYERLGELPHLWKTLVFCDALHAHPNAAHVVSIGDDEAEFAAAERAVEQLGRKARVTRVKLVGRPSLFTLVAQLAMLGEKLHHMQGADWRFEGPSAGPAADSGRPADGESGPETKLARCRKGRAANTKNDSLETQLGRHFEVVKSILWLEV